MTQTIAPLAQFEFLGMPAIIRSARMIELFERVERIARTNAAVLITGETGTGKELVARAIHQYSSRSSKPWVDINCSAIPEHLIESELFGFDKGAFSGAEQAKPGFFELASGGTLFLDEVGELDLRTQVKLLRILDGAAYYRLGGVRKVNTDVRIVAATNLDLEREVAKGRFRLDLLHRLAQLEIAVPPLRERPEDAVALADYFLKQVDGTLSLTDDALHHITRHPWPGNIRELRNAISSAAVNARGNMVSSSDLRIRRVDTGMPELNIDAMERKLITQALTASRGHHQKAADMLGISVRTLGRRLKRIS